MDTKNNVNSCVLSLIKLVFDEFSFKRVGFKNESDLKLDIKVGIGENEDKSINKVTLFAKGNKKNEYEISVKISGYFAIAQNSESKKETLLKKMP